MIVHDEQVDQPGVGHLQQILVLQFFGRRRERDRGFPFTRQLFIELHEALVVAARLPHEHLFARKVADGCDVRAAGSRDDDLFDTSDPWIGEIDDRLPLGSDREVSHHDVALAFEERWQQFVSRERDELDANRQASQSERLVEMFFEQFSLVVGRTARCAGVNEVQRSAVRSEDAHRAPFHHAIEIASPGLRDFGE